MLICTHVCNCNQRSFFAKTTFLFLEFVVCLLDPLGQIFIQIGWTIYALLYHHVSAYMWNLKRCFCQFYASGSCHKEEGVVFAARLLIPHWQILVLLKKGPFIGTNLHFKTVLCATWTTQWTHICWWLLVSDSKYVVHAGLYVFACSHIRTCYPLALCHFLRHRIHI